MKYSSYETCMMENDVIKYKILNFKFQNYFCQNVNHKKTTNDSLDAKIILSNDIFACFCCLCC